MTSDFEISFFSCDVPHGHLVTVKETGASLYIYVEAAARRIAHIITITSELFRSTVVRVLEFCRTAFFESTVINVALFAREGGLRL